jgi:hypothetical protein
MISKVDFNDNRYEVQDLYLLYGKSVNVVYKYYNLSFLIQRRNTMEKRRLLLVVMLLATSGAIFAGSDDESGTKKGRGARFKSGMSKKAKGGWHATIRFVTWPARFLTRTRPVNQFEVSLQPTTHEGDEDAVTVSQKAIDSLLEQYAKLERKLLYGTTVGLAVALILTARNKKVQEGVKKLVRGVRSIRFRKQTPRTQTPVDSAA